MVFISELPVGNGPLQGGCTLYLSNGTLTLLTFLSTDAFGDFSLTANVPNAPELECATILVQAVVFPVGGVPLYQVTNGLGLLLGY